MPAILRTLSRSAAVLNGYAAGQKLMERVLVSAAEDKTAAVRRLLERPDIDCMEVRDQTRWMFRLPYRARG